MLNIKAKPASNRRKTVPATLKALRRAGKKGVALARLTGTPAYVMKNGQIVDIARKKGNFRR